LWSARFELIAALITVFGPDTPIFGRKRKWPKTSKLVFDAENENEFRSALLYSGSMRRLCGVQAIIGAFGVAALAVLLHVDRGMDVFVLD